MIKKTLILLTALSSFNSAVAGKITTNPTASIGDEIISTKIRHSNITKFKVLAKTSLETFAIEVATYADAAALSTDLRKNSTTTHCRVKSNLRTGPVTTCKLVEVNFDD